MEPRPWRNRLDAEDELLQQLRTEMSQSGQRRAEALREGIAELGTIAAVARDRGTSERAISKSLSTYPPAATGQPTE